MNISSYPDLLGLNQRNRLTADVKARLETVSQELVTGEYADITARTNGRVGEVHQLNGAINDLDVEDRVNGLMETRLGLITSSLDSVTDTLTGFDTTAIIALNSDSDIALDTTVSQAEDNLRRVMDALDVRHGTRNLFSGDATDAPAFSSADQLISDVRDIMTGNNSAADIEAALNTYFDDPLGGFQTNIYTGGDNPPSATRLGNGQTISVDVKGDHEAIRDVLKGLSIIITADEAGFERDSDDYKTVFSLGSSSVGNGNSGLIQLNADMGSHAQTLEQITQSNNAERQTLVAALQTITNRDQFEAAGELQQLEVQLESSYIMTSRLSELTLTNYLR